MKMHRFRSRDCAIAVLLLVAACQEPAVTMPAQTAGVPAATERLQATHTHSVLTATAAVTSAPPQSSPTVQAVGTGESGFFDLPGARSINVVAGAGDTVYVLAGNGHDLNLYRSDDGGATFGAKVLVSQGTQSEVLAVVRPALAWRSEGGLSAAWVEMLAGQSKVRAAFSDDGGETFSTPETIATTSEPETTMASVTFNAAGNPLVVWLQNSTLQMAATAGNGADFTAPQQLDDLVCECCQPQPLAVEGMVFVAYRNLVRNGSGAASRDVHVLASADGGATFGEPVAVADGTWLIDACPIAGPALAAHEGTLYAAWMDGRHDDGTFTHTDVWVAASTDGGASFGANTRVNSIEGQYNGQPAMASDGSGRLHLAWEADEAGASVIHYAFSDDGGQTFSPAHVIASSAEMAGSARLGQAVLAVSDTGRIYIGWTDALGVHLTML